MTLNGLIFLVLFIVAPCVLAAWIGSRLRRTVLAFFFAWLLTPILTLVFELVLWPVLRSLIPPSNDGTGALMLPFFGVVTGLLAGGGAAIMAALRKKRGTAGG